MKNELDYEENDELIRLVTSNADASGQYVIFRNGHNELFAINVAKVDELIDLKEVQISKKSGEKALIYGVAKVRENIIPLIIFDDWLEKDAILFHQYELLILCNYGNKQFGIIIKNVFGIMHLAPKNLIDNFRNDPKTLYVTEIPYEDTIALCFVFDSDKILLEVFPQITQEENKKIDSLALSKTVTKKILHAEDSMVIQNVLKNMYEKQNFDFEFFQNGQLLLERLQELEENEISLIISDIEMPVMDGLTLVKAIKELPKYQNISIIVNTNMGNNSISAKAKLLGVKEIIHKLDVSVLLDAINEHAK